MADLLSTVQFSVLPNWSVRFLRSSSLGYKKEFKLYRIGDFLFRNRNLIEVEDDIEYRRVTVKLYNKGVIQRDAVLGKRIGTKRQCLIAPGQFIMSKIDARNGAFGIIPQELDGAIVTADFLTFNVDERKIAPRFLHLLTATEQFVQFCQNSSSGTTGRQRVKESEFLDIQIPLPDLKVQNRIVDAYYEKIRSALDYDEQAVQLEEWVEKFLSDELFYEEIKEEKRNRRLYFKSFSNINRWDVWANKSIASSSVYPNVVLGSVVLGKPQYGANVKGIKEYSDTRYVRITDINEDGTLNDEFVSPASVDEKYLLKHDDFLIARSGNTVGKTFLYDDKYGRCIYAGYLVKYILDSSLVMPLYVFYFSKSKVFKSWIESSQRISAQPNINGQEYLSSPLILPPLKKQKEIVEKISQVKEKIENLRNLAKSLHEGAIEEFENSIFE